MRRDNSHDEQFAQDSFLDVVANIVGVLIILVMLVGASASSSIVSSEQAAQEPEQKQLVAHEPIPEQPVTDLAEQQSQQDRAALEQQLELAEQKAAFHAREISKTTAHIINISHQSTRQERTRLELAVLRSQVEEDLQRRRDALSAEDQDKFNVQNEIFQAKQQLDELSNEQIRLLTEPGEVEQIDVQPTPVAKAIDEEPIHLRLLGGTICKVPLHELIKESEYEAASIQRELTNHGGVNRVIGPIDGFRLRIKTQLPASNGPVTGPLAGSPQARRRPNPVLYFQPVSDQLGVPLDQALLPDSSFRQSLQAERRRTSTVVAWIYEDSFDDYRSLRKMLSEMKYSIAVFNLPLGKDISASSQGSEAYAQ